MPRKASRPEEFIRRNIVSLLTADTLPVVDSADQDRLPT